MANTPHMLPKRDGSYVKLLYVINGANCEFTFFGNSKTEPEKRLETNWGKYFSFSISYKQLVKMTASTF